MEKFPAVSKSDPAFYPYSMGRFQQSTTFLEIFPKTGAYRYPSIVLETNPFLSGGPMSNKSGESKKMKSLVSVSTFLIGLVPMPFLLSACVPGNVEPSYDPKAREALVSLSAADREIVKNDNRFGLELFSGLSDDKDTGNIFVSPLNVSMLLSMAFNGARGGTGTAMAQVLSHGEMDRAGMNAFYSKLIPALTTADGSVQFKLANSIWSAPGFDAETDFIESNRAFDAETRSIDFTAAANVTTLNQWASEKTNGLIPTAVDPPLDPSLVMLLINALYFKGTWTTPFNSASTHDEAFHLANGTDKTCRMMSATHSFRHFHDATARGLELPYGDSLFTMVLLQPVDSSASGMSGLIHGLEAGAMAGWDGLFQVDEGFISVPKFKLEYGKSLVPVLRAMGMGAAFDDTADFTGIHHAGGVKLSEVMHKTFVSVDEKGTEAAAVTHGGFTGTAAPGEIANFNRPFVVVIREKTSGTLIFLGRIMDPTL
jgi:serine protease inhibitor